MRLPYWLRNLPHRLRGWKQELFTLAAIGVTAELSAIRINRDGTYTPLGVISRRVVTNAGVAQIANSFLNTFENENFNWHDSGTSATAESASDTTLVAVAGPARVSGTQSLPAANQYRTIATITYASTQTIQEHGVFSASTSGTLLDRSVFTGIGVNNGDSIQFTYTLTFNAGG